MNSTISKGKVINLDNRMIIGSNGTGRELVVFCLNEKQYAKFKNYCKANNYEFTMPYGKDTNKIIVCCEKSIFINFKSKYFYLFLKIPKRLLLFPIVLLFTLTGCIPRDMETVVISQPVSEPELYGLYDVVRVIDGDTIVVDVEGAETKVRFIGVDTAESVHPDESKNTESGKTASQWTSELLSGQQVYLEYDIDKEDDYGRTLAYVYLSDGETMVQEELLKNGMAELMTIQPNSKYADLFYDVKRGKMNEKNEK